MTKILLIFAILGTSVSFINAKCDISEYEDNSITCRGLHNGDLPAAVESFSGHYFELRIDTSPGLTILKSNSFPGLSFERLKVNAENLETVEDFLHGSEVSTKDINFWMCLKLRDFPFHYMEKFKNLERLLIGDTGLEVIPSDIKWPSTLTDILITRNLNLKSVEPYAFSSAVNLQHLSVREVSENFVVKSNGFHKSSGSASSILTVDDPGYITLEANAFGNVDGGQLWQTLNLGQSDFNEHALRLLIKAHFDKGHTSFFGQEAEAIMPCWNFMARHEKFNQSLSPKAFNCDYAWLYKDAQHFGFEQYKRLIGNKGAICLSVGPILETEDADLIAQINDCPYTPMPWPEDNDCKDVTDPMQSVVADSKNCHCFYDCAGGQVMGHECCEPGLAFNPSVLACDWSENVENCD